MMKRFFLMFALVAFAASGSFAQCVHVQLDRALFSDMETVTVNAMPSGIAADCASSASGNTNLRLLLERFNNESSKWEFVGDKIAPLSLQPGTNGRSQRTEVWTLNASGVRLTPGTYRIGVDTVAGRVVYADSVYFTLGRRTLGVRSLPLAISSDLGIVPVTGTSLPSSYNQPAPGAEEADRMPYVQPAAVVVNGYMYTRGRINPNGAGADGFLYQPRADMTEIVPVRFEAVSASDVAIVNLPQLRGGGLDLGWVRVRIPNNSFDATRPIFASITADKGGITVQGVIYDPTDPSNMVEGFGR